MLTLRMVSRLETKTIKIVTKLALLYSSCYPFEAMMYHAQIHHDSPIVIDTCIVVLIAAPPVHSPAYKRS